jgi:uncharacterized membrane protein
MRWQENTFRLLRFLLRLVGAVWIFVALMFALSSLFSSEHRFVYLSVTAFLLIAGVYLLVAKLDLEKLSARLRGHAEK